ncbi:MAG: hypothetical protein Q9214_006360 [Letrouitia sp. 1 TL-2023]
MLNTLTALTIWMTLSTPIPTGKKRTLNRGLPELSGPKIDFPSRRFVEYPEASIATKQTTTTSGPQISPFSSTRSQSTQNINSSDDESITISVPDSTFTLIIFLSRETVSSSLFAPLFSTAEAEIARQVHEYGHSALVPVTFRVRGPVQQPFSLGLEITALPVYRLQWNGMDAVMRGLRILIHVRERGLNRVFWFQILQSRMHVAEGKVEKFRAHQQRLPASPIGGMRVEK